jgi:hypothetical protein
MQSKLPMQRQLEMRSTHQTERETVPVASDEERAMQNARREIARSTERK